MKLLILSVLSTLCVASFAVDTQQPKKLVCFWNSTSFERTGLGKFQVEDLRPALSLCTHLIYGFAGIDASSLEAVPLNFQLDTGAGQSLFRQVTQLKRSFPDVKIYLGIGGNADPPEDTHKYLVVTETSENRAKFINSIGRLVADYDFDGVDLAWQFPVVKVQREKNVFRSVWKGFKNLIGKGNFHDQKEEEHRNGFTNLVRDLKNQLRARNNKALTISVLPHVNVSVYFDAWSLQPHIDAVHILAFDQRTPERNPKEADYPAPIYESDGRIPEDNVNSAVRYWTSHAVVKSKIIIGIPTFARTWKLVADSQISGVPPITTDGPGPQGPHSATPGLLSYPEVCSRLTESALGHLRRVNDPSKKYGSYAYQSYNQETGAEGIWVGFEDPDTAGDKANYVKVNGYGGAAIFDLSLDDFRGTCTGDKYPITRAVKYKVQ